MTAPLPGKSGWPAEAAVFELINAWDVLQLTDPPRRAEPEGRLRRAIDAIDQLGDWGGACPPEIVRAARHVTRRWLASSSEIRAGVLGACAQAQLDCLQAYLSGSIEKPIARLSYRQIAAGER